MRRDLAALLRQGVEDGVREAADHIIDVAKENTPVDTGELRDSAEVEASGSSATMSFEAPYALYVHENMRDQHATGGAKFLEKAMASERGKALEIVTGAVRKAWGG